MKINFILSAWTTIALVLLQLTGIASASWLAIAVPLLSAYTVYLIADTFFPKQKS